MNFPFDDAPNTVAITCCHIMNDNMPILHISHDSDDGMWQFLCGNPHDTSEGRIVSLHQIYMHDPTVAQLADMPCGYSADRQDITAAWRIRKFWTSTETYDALKIYMDMDFGGLRADIVQMLGGGRVKVNTKSFQNDMRNFRTKDDVLTLLIHLGYLAYDSGTAEAFIPNKEIIEEFENAMSVGGWSEVMRVLKESEKLLENTLLCDGDSVAEALDRAHTEVSSILTYNDENSLACAIGLAYYSARKDYRLIREFPTGKGFADIVFLPLPHTGRPALVVELKYDRSVSSAIQQLRDRHYTQAFEGYTGQILLVGITYKEENQTKPHSCVIEKMEKM